MTTLDQLKKEAREEFQAARLCGNISEPNSTCEDCEKRANALIKAKLIELVPEKADASIYDKTITLADILRAIGTLKYRVLGIDMFGFFLEWEVSANTYHIMMPGARWNLTTDYDGQTQEVKDFIGSLLGV